MKKSEMIRAAKEVLWREKYICIAIGEVAGLYRRGGANERERTARAVQAWIEDLLGEDADGQRTYAEWLRDNHPDLYNSADDNTFYEARLQWMDWMIAYWEERGE